MTALLELEIATELGGDLENVVRDVAGVEMDTVVVAKGDTEIDDTTAETRVEELDDERATLTTLPLVVKNNCVIGLT